MEDLVTYTKNLGPGESKPFFFLLKSLWIDWFDSRGKAAFLLQKIGDAALGFSVHRARAHSGFLLRICCCPSGLLPTFYKSQPCQKHSARFAMLMGKCRKCFSVTVTPKAILSPGHPILQHSFAVCQLACRSSWLLSLLISCLLLWTYALAQGCKSVIRPLRREELLWLNLIWNDYLAIWTLNIQNIQMPAFDLIAITWPQESINYE